MKNNTIKILLSLMLLACCFIGCKEKTTKPNERVVQSTTEKMVEVNKILLKKDEQRIKGFIKRKGWKMTMTETGLWYKINKEGDGAKINTDQVVFLNYEVQLLDGTKCYSSDNDGVKNFLVGKGGVERGLEEAVLLLKVGDEATFIMPPHLAHGLPGDGSKIPARSIIVYNVEIIDVKNRSEL